MSWNYIEETVQKNVNLCVFNFFGKNLKKGVDSWRKMSYISLAVNENCFSNRNNSKLFQKNKKVVDK